jgi:hypothetical protein
MMFAPHVRRPHQQNNIASLNRDWIDLDQSPDCSADAPRLEPWFREENKRIKIRISH